MNDSIDLYKFRNELLDFISVNQELKSKNVDEVEQKFNSILSKISESDSHEVQEILVIYEEGIRDFQEKIKKAMGFS